jgi:benzoyl-CoA-dihydrodiol lyase
LTRLVDKRRVRRDRADYFCTIEEGVRGKRALEWRLVDAVVPASSFDGHVRERALHLAAGSDRPAAARGVVLTPLARTFERDRLHYPYLEIDIDRTARCATFVVHGPPTDVPTDIEAILDAGADFWPLALARALDDAILHLRFNEEEIGTWVFKSRGDGARVLAADAALAAHAQHWFVREVTLYLKRVLKRIDVSARSLIAAVEPGSCFAGTLLELVLAADQSFMLAGRFDGDETPPATLVLGAQNFGRYPMVHGLTRLATRFLDEDATLAALEREQGAALDAARAAEFGLVTFTPDDIDWADEIRLTVEARAGFSPDALTGMEASLRFPGPETLESKIFARLSAWQNWIFQRPNAVGEHGALSLYGTGVKPQLQKRRV